MFGTRKADLNDSVVLSESRIEIAVHHIHYILSHVPPLEPVDKESSYEIWCQLEARKLSSNALDEDTNSHISKDVFLPIAVFKKKRLKFTKAWLSFL